MNLDELRQELRTGRLRPAYLLAGAEPLLRDDALGTILDAALGDAPRDFNLDRLDGDATSGARLLDVVRMVPVMAPRRLVVVREVESRRAGSHGLLEALEQVLGELEDGGPTVLVVCAERIDRRSAWVKGFRSPGAVVECDPPVRGREVAAFVRGEAARQGLKLAPGVDQLLAERIGPRLLMLRQELSKASLHAGSPGTLTRAQVLELTGDLSEEPIWSLTDAIAEGRTADALAVLAKLRATGSAAPVLLGALASHFRRLLRVRAGGEVSAPPFVRRKLEAQARRYTLEQAQAYLCAIHRTDEALKGQGALPADLALERLVLSFAR